ncbi:Ig-like domain-containing protein, partial [Enterobacillus tribolii]|uniref:Ig-like domain-containing protein n=1 Tax=Enterobacillus tribolii TaxID=1487935 RepID=UPI000E1C5DD4
TAPALTIDTIAGDNIINATEHGQTLTITGTSNAEAGQTVTVSVNGTDYTTTVNADGTWSVAGVDASGLADGTHTITANVSDKAGNTADAGQTVLVDATRPVVTINTDVAGDDIINLAEHGQALIINGSCAGAAPGDTVTVTLNGKNYTTTLDAAGNWSVGVPAADVGALSEGSHTITASVTDKAGNVGDATHSVDVALTAPVLGIDVIAGDDIINNTEKLSDLTISGSVTGLNDGDTVTITLNGQQYIGTVSGNTWTTTVPAGDVANLGNAFYQVVVSATDSAGNNTDLSQTLQVQTSRPGVTIDMIAGDDVMNLSEVQVEQTISGRVSGVDAGTVVTLNIGGKEYTAIVQADMTWKTTISSADLIALGNGSITVTASVQDSAGNQSEVGRDFTIDAGLPGLRIDTVAGDDIVNAIEHQQALIISGTSSDVPAGNVVTVTVNGVSYPATVGQDGTWSVGVPAADVSAWPAGPLTIMAEAANASGNASDIGHVVTVDLSEVAVSINTVALDNVINAAEKGTALELNGATQNVEAGQVVKVVFAGHSYDAVVQADGSWSVTVPAADMGGLREGADQVQVSVVNQAGNTASAAQELVVDTTAPTLTIDPVAGDNILNAAEHGQALTLTGTSNAEAGQTVTVTVNGADYT